MNDVKRGNLTIVFWTFLLVFVVMSNTVNAQKIIVDGKQIVNGKEGNLGEAENDLKAMYTSISAAVSTRSQVDVNFSSRTGMFGFPPIYGAGYFSAGIELNGLLIEVGRFQAICPICGLLSALFGDSDPSEALLPSGDLITMGYAHPIGKKEARLGGYITQARFDGGNGYFGGVEYRNGNGSIRLGGSNLGADLALGIRIPLNKR